jgi:4'-phosphopantetheinyl transferase
MPQIREERINDRTLIGIWEISESSRELEELIKPDLHEQELLSTFRNETRRQHWLSYRILIRQMLKEKGGSVQYHDSGKPYIVNPEGHISVTHSGPYSAVIYSEESAVGIDIERIHPRIEKVAHKFLSDNELENIKSEKRIQHMVTLWAAKEALYKLRGLLEVDFREHMYIGPFVPDQKGTFNGYTIYKQTKTEYLLHYFLIADYILVWVKNDL